MKRTAVEVMCYSCQVSTEDANAATRTAMPDTPTFIPRTTVVSVSSSCSPRRKKLVAVCYSEIMVPAQRHANIIHDSSKLPVSTLAFLSTPLHAPTPGSSILLQILRTRIPNPILLYREQTIALRQARTIINLTDPRLPPSLLETQPRR